MQSKRVTDIPGLQHCWQVENIFLAGQPTLESLDTLKQLGVSKVFNLRNEGEGDFSGIEKRCKELGMEYHQIPIIIDGMLDKGNCDKLSNLIDESSNNFVHCGTANRVNGWFMTYLTKYKGMDFEDAIDVASASGLSSPALIDQAEQIVNE